MAFYLLHNYMDFIYNANKVKEQLIKNELLKTMKIEIVLLLFLRIIRL